MARRSKNKGRNVHGILLLDKPAGITSNQALQQVKHLFQARKAGHTGSLDRQATGLLPLCLGEATKFSGYLLDADKEYVALCTLGVQTSTGDAEGNVLHTIQVPPLTKDAMTSILEEFKGVITQVPPMHSALKHQGQRLYELAYQGIEVERAPRAVTIHELELLSLTSNEFEIRVRCSKGTYIRTLAEDIGKRIGCGAHVKTLRRLAAGPFRAEQMITLPDLQKLAETGLEALDQHLLPMDYALHHVAEIEVSPSLAFYLGQGQAVIVPHAPTEGLVRMYDKQKRFLGVGEVLDDGRISPRRLVLAGNGSA